MNLGLEFMYYYLIVLAFIACTVGLYYIEKKIEKFINNGV